MQITTPTNFGSIKARPAILGGSKVVLLLLIFSIFLSSCSIWETGGCCFGGRGNDDEVPETAFGQRPIYAREDAFDIFSDVPRAIQNGIAVFEENDLLFTVDANLLLGWEQANLVRPQCRI